MWGERMNETIYLNKKAYEVLNVLPGDNISQKVKYLIEQYENQRSDK